MSEVVFADLLPYFSRSAKRELLIHHMCALLVTVFGVTVEHNEERGTLIYYVKTFLVFRELGL